MLVTLKDGLVNMRGWDVVEGIPRPEVREAGT